MSSGGIPADIYELLAYYIDHVDYIFAMAERNHIIRRRIQTRGFWKRWVLSKTVRGNHSFIEHQLRTHLSAAIDISFVWIRERGSGCAILEPFIMYEVDRENLIDEVVRRHIKPRLNSPSYFGWYYRHHLCDLHCTGMIWQWEADEFNNFPKSIVINDPYIIRRSIHPSLPIRTLIDARGNQHQLRHIIACVRCDIAFTRVGSVNNKQRWWTDDLIN